MTYIIIFFVVCAIIAIAAIGMATLVEEDADRVDREEDPLQAEWDYANIESATNPAPLTWDETYIKRGKKK